MKSEQRFLSVDPLADNSNNNSLSLYHYVSNNPIRNVDPDGRDWYENNETGQMLWQKGSDAIDGHTKRGEFYEHKNRNGSVTVFEQQHVYKQFNSMDDYDGSYLRPASAYSYEGSEGTTADDAKYWGNGKKGTVVSRIGETLSRNINEPRNAENVEDAKLAVESQGGILHRPFKSLLRIRKGERNLTSKSSGTNTLLRK